MTAGYGRHIAMATLLVVLGQGAAACFSSTGGGGGDGGMSGGSGGDGSGGDGGDGDGDGGDGDGGDGDGGDGDGGDGDGDCTALQPEKLDILFVVDDSQSMAQEQTALREQFPKLMRTLAAGQLALADGGVLDFTPVEDIHLGVVSTDMGLPGVSGITACQGLGDDGLLQNTPGTDPNLSCASAYPKFLAFDGAGGASPDQVAADLACIASLGIEGCGFEQQLEAGLKALWPSVDIDPNTGMEWIDPNTGMPANRITFLPDTNGNGRLGHGDGENAGFLRNGEAASLLLVVVVTDEEDCSSSTTEIFQPAMFLPEGSPYKTQPINLRCYLNKATALYSIDRYVNGLRALRPGAEHLVMFAAIAGVPPDLTQLRGGDGALLRDLDDDVEREAFYDEMLADPRMEEVINTDEPEVAKRGLIPSCGSLGSDATSRAYPPRRIVEVAREFGRHGIMQSICEADLSTPMDAILERVVWRLNADTCW